MKRLGICFIVNPSWYLSVCFRFVKPLLDPVTASKLNFVDLKSASRKKVGSDMEGFGAYLSILEYIDPDQLLTEYGGSFEMPWDFDSYWKAFTQI